MLSSMRFSALILLSVAALTPVVGLSGCKLRKDPPPPAPLAPVVAPTPVKPTTGWTETINRESTKTLVDALIADGWVSRFREGNARMPVIAVSSFEDRSADHVPVDEVAFEFVRLLGASDRVLAASAGQVADVTLSGVIGLRTAADGTKEFTIDARIVEGKASELLWVAGVSRAYPAASQAAPAPAAGDPAAVAPAVK